ncbi:MAG TPA: FAD-binding protein, partial [Clostridiales bacterium]|nr:FAD-binding protein [Clostridiales bacterium]
MKYLYCKKKPDVTLEYDVAVVGMGVAGLYCALNIDPKLRVVIFNKFGEEESNSIHAQGGIASVTLKEDSVENHVHDTLVAGAGMCDEKAVMTLVSEGPENMVRLADLGVPFDKDAQGKLSITREGAHRCNRILHCGGDATGKHMTETLLARVHERENITILDHAMLIDIVEAADGGVAGILIEKDGENILVKTPNAVIASGGIGRIYRNSTNAIAATGDGIAAAMRAGAAVENMEFVQFHPTAMIHPGVGGRYFLISEALRGEGAVLRNRRWEAFMKDVHPMADLAPRDVVSRAIIMQMQKYDLPNVYLDITSK